MATVTIKFSKDSYDIAIDQDETLESFQAKVYALTTVPPRSMKLLLKGKEIKDDATVTSLKDASVITLFGTKEDKALKKIETSAPVAVQKTATSKVIH